MEVNTMLKQGMDLVDDVRTDLLLYYNRHSLSSLCSTAITRPLFGQLFRRRGKTEAFTQTPPIVMPVWVVSVPQFQAMAFAALAIVAVVVAAAIWSRRERATMQVAQVIFPAASIASGDEAETATVPEALGKVMVRVLVGSVIAKVVLFASAVEPSKTKGEAPVMLAPVQRHVAVRGQSLRSRKRAVISSRDSGLTQGNRGCCRCSKVKHGGRINR